MKAGIAFMAICILSIHCDTFAQFKLDMEEKVQNLALRMDEIFESRCNYSIATCEVFSYYECNGTDSKKCFTDFPNSPACVGEGVFLSESSAVNFPPEAELNALSTEEKQFVCTSALLQDDFQALDDGRKKRYGRAFIGTSTGAFRSYPATGGCYDYDPRYRPWYVAATAGAKNVILMIDTSGSMQDGNRMGLTIDAAVDVVNTLSNADYVGAVQFNTQAYTLYSDKMQRATTEVKQGLVSAISGLSANGGTNYEDGIRKAFKMFNAAQDDEFGAPCTNGQNIFMFLSDGEPTYGQTDLSAILNIINEYNKDIRMFTYGLGSGVRTDILKAMACDHEGMMFTYDESAGDEGLGLRNVMRNYYTFMAEGGSITQPVWTEPYEDAFELGWLVTVSVPIYYYENDIRTILGVIGLDVSLEHLMSYGYTQEEVTKLLITSAACYSSNITDCELEELREVSCDVSGCSSNSDSLETCDNLPPDNIFKDPVENNGYICCGLSVGLLVVVIILSVLIVGIGIGVGVYCMKKRAAQSG